MAAAKRSEAAAVVSAGARLAGTTQGAGQAEECAGQVEGAGPTAEPAFLAVVAERGRRCRYLDLRIEAEVAIEQNDIDESLELFPD